MTHAEIVALIQAGVAPGTWADFGAGAGNFTRALMDLLNDGATVYAVDRDGSALEQLARRLPTVHTIQADFTQPLDLPLLDGLLIANALHFVRQQERVLGRLLAYLKDGGRLIVVEYDVRLPRSYIPFPLPYTRLVSLTETLNMNNVNQIGIRTSPRTGVTMYAAQVMKKLQISN